MNFKQIERAGVWHESPGVKYQSYINFSPHGQNTLKTSLKG